MCDHHHHHHHNEGLSLNFLCSSMTSGWKIFEAKLLMIYSMSLGVSSTFEIFYGLATSDSHIVTEGFHTLFHALCIWAAMIALSYESTHKSPDKKYSFGYNRVQVISAFGNSIFAFFIAFFALFEAIHNIFTEKASDSNPNLLPIIISKIFLHSLFFFYIKEKLFDNEKTSNDNLAVVALHCLGLLITDLIRASSLYFELECFAYPLYHTESVLNILWVFILLMLIKPRLYRNGRILLLCSPQGKHKELLEKKIREISLIEGVVSVKEDKVWMLNNLDMVGSLTIEVHGDGKHIVGRAKDILKGTLTFVTVELEYSDILENYT
jgi:Co/Zn/Cd efflux system component